MSIISRIRSRLPSFRLLKRWRMVSHVRAVARIRDANTSPEVKAACTTLLHALVNGES